jgi:CRISPR-associated protein Cmx8
MAKTKSIDEVEVLKLEYNLAELPSSQHRAGLAGLVLMVRWLERQGTNKGICEIECIDEHSATLKIDKPGLEALFNEVYAASSEERAEAKLRKKKSSGELIPPLREEQREEIDDKGKAKTKTLYIYPATVPKGAFLVDFDPSANGDKGVWIKLWRDVLWSIFRGVPATRTPFENRAENEPTDDAAKTWNELIQPSGFVVDLPSTYFIGAQACNAENVPFKDRPRFQFLLHFWNYVAQIYVPQVINNEGDREFVGFALAIPDVANLEWFCEELPKVLRKRSIELSGYRPRDSVIDLAVEGALDVLRRLQERLTVREGEVATNDLVLGVDVLHVEKQGNSIKLLGSSRVDPEAQMIDEYARLKHNLWNPIFKHQRLLNLVNHRLWYSGFDALLSRLPYKELFAEEKSGFKFFKHDIQESFNIKSEKEDDNHMNTEVSKNESEKAGSQTAVNWEALIYRMVGTYISRKLKSKYQLEWEQVKNDPGKKKDYDDAREKIAKDAFLAVRSRTGMDFANYFASTICSVSQNMSEDSFVALSQALHLDTEKVRTLTMLALSARS